MRLPRTLTNRPLILTLALAGALVLFAAAGRGLETTAPPPARDPHPRPALTADAAREAYSRVEMSFEENRGQTDPSVNFLARGAGYTLFLKPTEAVFSLRSSPSKVLRMRLVGADESARAEGSDELAGRANYFVGSDPRAWRTGVPTFARVKYESVYPGTDLVYYGNQQQLEYDFHVAPGHDPRRVRLRFEGADRVEEDAAGDLLLHLGDGRLRQPKPFVYQEVAGTRRAVEGGYVVEGDGLVSFRVGEYDPTLPLVIDPVLVYSTYLGGSGTEDGNDIKVDSAGSAYVCGETNSTNFPTANAFQPTFGGATFEGGRDAFVTKLNPAGTAFVYSTYLGGNGDDRCNKITVDAGGNAYLAGETTSSTNFPTANAFQATFGGGLSDAFVTKLNPAGSALVFSTYLGGSIFDSGNGIALDSSNNVYVTGRTTSANFPTANAIQATQASQFADAYVTKLNAAGSALVYSTYLGGSGGEAFDAGFSIAVDSAGAAYVTGQTTSTNFPTVNPVQATFGGGFPDGDTFVTKINAAGSALAYSTYLGGSENDIGFEIALDSAGSAHVSGVTRSTNFPTANAMRATLSGPSDAFVTKLNPAGTAFAYSTYFGGSGDDSANGIAVDSAGNTYLAIGTSSTDFPTLNPTQAATGGGIDAAVTKLNPAGSALIFSTYLGGSGLDAGLSIALDAANSIYLVGRTASTNFPTLNPVQAANGGDQDAFVAKISDPPPASSTFQFSAATFDATEGAAFATGTGAGELSELEAARALAVGFALVQVTRTGDLSQPAEVTYATAPGTASDRGDYTAAYGTLRFAANEASKSLVILVTDDVYQEAVESFTVALSNPIGAGLGAQSSAAVQITSDDATTGANPVEKETLDTDKFVRYHYADFLNRLPDAAGLDFWKSQIDDCGTDMQCREVRMVNVSAAFYLSIEFQETGSLVYRFHEAAFNTGERLRLPRFLADTQEIRAGVVIGQPGAGQQLETNKQNFAARFVQRPEFLALYPATMEPAPFVDALNANAGGPLSPSERDEVVAQLTAAGNTATARANALRRIAEDQDFVRAELNRAFVLMQYFGYLRRNPDDVGFNGQPDPDLEGFNFWLQKLNAFDGNFVNAEMVRAFIVSIEYQTRFGP